VFAGMLGVTFFGLLLTPVFYVLIRRLSQRRPAADSHSADSEPKSHGLVVHLSSPEAH